MTTTGRTTAVGAFTERAMADHAIEELRLAGFSEDYIGFITSHQRSADSDEYIADDASLPNTTTGAVGGGVLGGVVGAVVSLLIPGFGPAIAGGILAATLGGAAIGAVAGGFVGSLVHAGVPEDEANYYQEQLSRGSTIVTVTAPERYEEAAAILRRCGAYDAAVRPDMPDSSDLPHTGFFGNAGALPPAILPGAALGMGTASTAGMVSPLQPALYAAVISGNAGEYGEQVESSYIPAEPERQTTYSEPEQTVNPTYTPQSSAEVTNTATLERYHAYQKDQDASSHTTTADFPTDPSIRSGASLTDTTGPGYSTETTTVERSQTIPDLRKQSVDVNKNEKRPTPDLPDDSQVW